MATTLTRADLLEAISRELKLPRHQATHFLEFFIETMVDAIAEEEGLKIASFGSFKVRQKSRRIGRNPKTGKEAVITPRRVLSFNPSLYLRKRVQLRKP
jgi:integration host factor subunit alpha